MKENAILCSHLGELGWEILRFCPYIIWNKSKKYKNNVKLIIHTRQDRYDLYGSYADIFEPLILPPELKADCFGVKGFKNNKYSAILKEVHNKYKNRYEIKEHIYPILKNNQFQRKDQFHQNKMIYDFNPRPKNIELVNTWIPNDNPVVVLAPRYRDGFARNWPHWIELYDLIYNDSYLINNFTFVLCGKDPEYIPDPECRFHDINLFEQTEDTSLIGITLAVLKKALLTVGSQSGIPNLSNLVGTPTLQWGHEQWQHEKTYNIKKTPTSFLKVGNNRSNYGELKAGTVIKEIKRLLKSKGRSK